MGCSNGLCCYYSLYCSIYLGDLVYQTMKGYVMPPFVYAILTTFGPLVGYIADSLLIPDTTGSFLGFAVAVAWSGTGLILTFRISW